MKEDPTTNVFSIATQCSFLLHSIFPILGTLFGALYLVFAEIKPSNFIFAGYLTGASLLIIGGVCLFKLLINFINDKLEVKEIDRYRNDYFIVFGLSGIWSTVIRIVVFFIDMNRIEEKVKACPKDFLYFLFLYCVLMSSVYYFFIFSIMDKKCTWARTDQVGGFFDKSVIAHIVLFIVTTRIAMEYELPIRATIIFIQFISGYLFVGAFPIFIYVLVNGLRLISEEERKDECDKKPVKLNEVANKSNAKPQPTVMSKPEYVVVPKPTCNTCSVPYTEKGSHTPRMIKECGHTVCKQCANTLIKKKLLKCPFCQKITVVNGSSKTLPKNFALLEQMREVKQKDPIKID